MFPYNGYGDVIPWGVNKPPVPFINYIMNVPAAEYPVSVDQAKTQARIELTETADDTFITNLIAVATEYCERYVRRDIINKTYIGYLDFFPRCHPRQGIELERSKLQSITSIQYYNIDGILTTINPNDYYTTFSNDFSSLYLKSTASWPTDIQDRKQAILITFVAGYAATRLTLPANTALLLQGILQHITAMYQSRGDAGDGGYDETLPKTAQTIYDQYKIILMK